MNAEDEVRASTSNRSAFKAAAALTPLRWAGP
jgi:hypothetical protein